MPLEIINPTTYTDSQASLVVPPGTIIASSLHIRPTGFLDCDGSNTVSRTTYSALFNAIVPNKGTVTITDAATLALVTLNSHGFLTGESIFLTTTGSLFTNLAPNTLYFVIVIDSNTFRLATSYANALSSTAINVSGTQSGTHTLFYCPYGLGSTTASFKLPDLRNATIRGRGLPTHGLFTNPLTTRLGYIENDAFGSHNHGGGSHSHSINVTAGYNYAPWAVYAQPSGGDLPSGNTTASTNGSGTILTTQGDTETKVKNQGVNFFIKF